VFDLVPFARARRIVANFDDHSQFLPPATNGFDGECGSILADADGNTSLVFADIVYPIRNRLASLFVRKVMRVDLDGFAFGAISTTAIRFIPKVFFLLRPVPACLACAKFW